MKHRFLAGTIGLASLIGVSAVALYGARAVKKHNNKIQNKIQSIVDKHPYAEQIDLFMKMVIDSLTSDEIHIYQDFRFDVHIVAGNDPLSKILREISVNLPKAKDRSVYLDQALNKLKSKCSNRIFIEFMHILFHSMITGNVNASQYKAFYNIEKWHFDNVSDEIHHLRKQLILA